MRTLLLAGVVAVGWVGAARATPSYAYAELSFTNLNLNIGTALIDSSSVTASDSAGYPGYTSVLNSAGGNLLTGTDPVEATSGPGTFPGQNVFTQALLPAGSLTPAGTRGDVQQTGALAVNATLNLVGEGKLAVAGATTSAGSSVSDTLNVTAIVNTTLMLTFNASSMVQAIVGTSGDSASASVSATYKVVDTATGTPITITDNINAANSGTAIMPFALNQSAATTTALPQTFMSPSTVYSYSATLLSGHSYQVTLLDTTSILLQTAGAATVPEPASLALLVLPVAGLIVVRRRRKGEPAACAPETMQPIDGCWDATLAA